MKYTDLIWELPNAIPNTLCDDLVNFFEERTDLQRQGVSGIGYNPNVKRSTDISLDSDNAPELDKQLYEIITEHNRNYVELYATKLWPESFRDTQVYSQVMSDTGYQMQKTVKDEFYTWHNDFDIDPVLDTIPTIKASENKIVVNERIFTFLYYLSGDIEGGHTQFYFGGEIHNIIPEKGKGIWFPANSLYTHRGEPVISGEKYVVTGWVYRSKYRAARQTCLLSEETRSEYGEDNMVFLLDDDGQLVDRSL